MIQYYFCCCYRPTLAAQRSAELPEEEESVSWCPRSEPELHARLLHRDPSKGGALTPVREGRCEDGVKNSAAFCTRTLSFIYLFIHSLSTRPPPPPPSRNGFLLFSLVNCAIEMKRTQMKPGGKSQRTTRRGEMESAINLNYEYNYA